MGGGTAVSQNGRINFTHTTIASNTAPEGANTWLQTGSVLSFRSSIVAYPNGGTNCDVPVTSTGFNVEFPGASCGFEIRGDPVLGALTNNGGSTFTRSLGAGSVAIDAVTAGCPPPATDQRGTTRPIDGNSDGIAACDAGAFETAAGTSSAPGGGVPGAPGGPIAPGGPNAQQLNDGNPEDSKPTETKQAKANRQHTNNLGLDAFATEGQVRGVRLSASDPIPSILENTATPLQFDPNKGMPYIVIENKDGLVQVQLRSNEAKEQGKSARPGQYVQVEGDKDNEFLYYADDLDLKDIRSVEQPGMLATVRSWLGLGSGN